MGNLMDVIRSIRATPGTNQDGASAHNRRVIIDALRINGPISRADLARATSLTKQAVSNIVEQLANEGFIEALPAVKRGRGQPFTPYQLVPEGAFAVGLQIDRYVVRAVMVDFLGQPRFRAQAAISSEAPEDGVEIISKLIDGLREKLAASAPDWDQRIVGLGVAMPGPFGVSANAHNKWMMSAWQSYPLREKLAEKTGLAPEIQNDAAASAIAERMVGAANAVDNAVCLFLGFGIGTGLILNGDIFRGANGNAGEIGMALAPCVDGETTLEHSASLASLYSALQIDPALPDIYARVDALVQARDPALEKWVICAAEDLRRSIQLLENLFDPETIIFCGGAPQSLVSRLIDEMQPLLPSIVADRVRSVPRLQLGRTDPWSVAQGAAVEPISRTFDPRYSALWKGQPKVD